MMDETQEYNLELMLDSSTLADMLESLENICYTKGGHLKQNWQDSPSAKSWDQAGKRLGTLIHAPAILKVS